MYVYLVERKSDNKRFAMVGDIDDTNAGSGTYSYNFTSANKYAIKTPYGLRSNVSTGKNSKQYKIIHCTKI